MRVYLVRHGTANPEDEDPERHLSRSGQNEAKNIGDFLGKVVANKIRVIYHSPKARARETAEIIGKHLGVTDFVEDGMLVPTAEPGEWAYKLSQSQDDVMLVGHLPNLERLASLLLCSDSEQARFNIKAAGALCLEREEGGDWSLVWMVEPGLLGL